MWQLKITATAAAVIGSSLALTLIAPDLNPLVRDIGMAVVVGLAVMGVRWSSKACAEPGKMAVALLVGASVGLTLLLLLAPPDSEDLIGTIEVGVLVRVGLRRAALIIAAAMGSMALFELLRWRLDKALAKASPSAEDAP